MKRTTICNNCGADYIPKRRGVQKFCSNSCRSRNWLLKQDKPKIIENLNDQDKIQVPTSLNVPKKETMSLAGVGNAAIGVAAVDIFKNLLTPDDKKTANKRDIAELKTLIKGQRFFEVKNIPKDNYNRKAYYDIETGNIVFLNIS